MATTPTEFAGILPTAVVTDVRCPGIEGDRYPRRPEYSLAVRCRSIVIKPLDDRLPGHPLRVKVIDRDEYVPDMIVISYLRVDSG